MNGLGLRPLNAIDVCAGSGIGSAVFEALGLARTVCYIERDPYCQRLLQARMRDGWIADAPLWDDITTFDGRPWRGRVDFVFGGIPCQPWSCAGKREGSADARDLWPDLRRVIREVGPRVVLVENVPGIAAGPDGLGRILGQLSEDGYDAEWHCIGADDVGAPHRRKRLWVVAYPTESDARGRSEQLQGSELAHRKSAQLLPDAGSGGRTPESRSDYAADPARLLGPAVVWREQVGVLPAVPDADGGGRDRWADEQGQQAAGRVWPGGGREDVADADEFGRLGRPWAEWSGRGREPEDGGWWGTEPDVGRVADGVASRVDRLRILGNGWVPQVAAVIAGRIAELTGRRVTA